MIFIYDLKKQILRAFPNAHKAALFMWGCDINDYVWFTGKKIESSSVKELEDTMQKELDNGNESGTPQ